MKGVRAIENVEHKGRQEEYLGCRGSSERLVFREDGLLSLTANLITPKPNRLYRATSRGDDKGAGEKSGGIIPALCHQFVDRAERRPVFGGCDASCARRRRQRLDFFHGISEICGEGAELATPIP